MVRGRAREQELIGFLGGVGGGASMWSKGGGYREAGEFWGESTRSRMFKEKKNLFPSVLFAICCSEIGVISGRENK
jgi:hypothetical protein